MIPHLKLIRPVGRGADGCSLSILDRVSRLAEFDDVVGSDLLGQERTDERSLCWLLRAESETTVRGLVARESERCSFFTLAITAESTGLRVDVEVTADRVAMLDALQARTAAVLAKR